MAARIEQQPDQPSTAGPRDGNKEVPLVAMEAQFPGLIDRTGV
ncbi:hypothetical protein [Streptomyces sp. NPDC056291]